MGIFKKDELLLDFKGVQTEDVSSTIPYMNRLNAEAKILVNHLGPNAANAANAINRKGLVLFNESEQHDMYRLFEKSTTLNNNDNNFSETSPFISSDVYNQLLNKLKNKRLTGGGKSKSSRRKSSRSSRSSGSRNEDRDDDFEEESSTTSSEESESDKKKKKIKKMFKEQSDEIDLESEEEEEEFSEMSAGSYVSSSAHTDGSETSNDSESYKSSSMATSTVSVRNHRSRHHNVSDSVNTSDINIISVDE